MYRFSPTTGGFYRQDLHGDDIPEDSIEVSDEQRDTLIAGNGAGLQIVVVDGVPQLAAPQAVPLAQTKASLCAQIDAAADAVYVAIGGPSPGRMAEYQQAKSDALTFKGNGYAGAAPVTISCWAQAQGWTDQAACDDILATAAQWEGALQGIRAARLTGKASVNAAPDAAAAHATADAVVAGILAVTGG